VLALKSIIVLKVDYCSNVLSEVTAFLAKNEVNVLEVTQYAGIVDRKHSLEVFMRVNIPSGSGKIDFRSFVDNFKNFVDKQYGGTNRIAQVRLHREEIVDAVYRI